ncbi:hypothetical protein MP228_011960 [Amoeboaphelidium protococcarum]|nr:hypothetical protein MP228_011960 [Amoeboaphelidium protococcarum]
MALKRIRQPTVLGHILTGILIGPSVLGQIPGFRESLFPDSSMPLLNGDVWPVFNFRDHSGSVDFISFTTLLTDNYGDGSVGTFVSGGYDSIVRLWSLQLQVEPYGKYEPSNVQLAFISAFDDIVYDVEFSLDSSRFGALSAPGFKVYSIDGIEEKDYWQKALSSMLNFDTATSSFDFVKNDSEKILVIFADGSVDVMIWNSRVR